MNLLSNENQSCVWTAKEKLRQAKNNFLQIRKAGDLEAKKYKRAVRRDILLTRVELVQQIKES